MRKRTQIYKVICMVTMSFLHQVACMAQQPGELDLSFGDGGVVITNINDRDNVINNFGLQSDGKIVCVGKITTGLQNDDILLARFLPNGQPDPSFGQNGSVVIALSSSNDLGRDVVIRENEKIIIVGRTTNLGEVDLSMLQFLPNGNPDSSFGNNGVVIMDIDNADNSLSTINLLSDGILLTSGTKESDMVLMQFLENGSLDTSFADSGIRLIDLGTIQEVPSALAPLNDGRFLICGYMGPATSVDAMVCMFNSDGTLHSGFNNTGWMNLELNTSGHDFATDIQVTEGGDIYVTGFIYYESNNSELYLMKMNLEGVLDPTFGLNGIASFDVGLGNNYAVGLVIQPDNRILLCGATSDGDDNNSLLLRINSTGVLDSTFGDNGVVITTISTDDDQLNSILLQSDGKILVAGVSDNGTDKDISLARYHSGLNISVQEVTESDNLKIYPNPSTGSLQVASEEIINQLTIFNMEGRTILSKPATTNHHTLDLSGLAAGIYTLTVETENNKLTRKLVVEQKMK